MAGKGPSTPSLLCCIKAKLIQLYMCQVIDKQHFSLSYYVNQIKNCLNAAMLLPVKENSKLWASTIHFIPNFPKYSTFALCHSCL